MLANTIWMTAIIGGPVLMICALAYAFIKNRRMTADDRVELREAVDERYEDADDGDVPVRVDMERRCSLDARRRGGPTGRRAMSYASSRLSHG